MNNDEKIQAQRMAMDPGLNRSDLYYGAQRQEEGIMRAMRDDLQVLKQDVHKLKDAINYIQNFLQKAFPND